MKVEKYDENKVKIYLIDKPKNIFPDFNEQQIKDLLINRDDNYLNTYFKFFYIYYHNILYLQNYINKSNNYKLKQIIHFQINIPKNKDILNKDIMQAFYSNTLKYINHSINIIKTQFDLNDNHTKNIYNLLHNLKNIEVIIPNKLFSN